MHFSCNIKKLASSLQDLECRGDIIATLFVDDYRINFETNGEEDDSYYEIVIYQRNKNGEYIEQWFSEPIYDEEKPDTPEELKGLMLDCLSLV
jgi:hypothetical protein